MPLDGTVEARDQAGRNISPADGRSRTDEHVSARVAKPSLFRSPDGPVLLTGVTVNHDRVTVPPSAGLSFSAGKAPANATGVTFSLVGINATIAAGTTIDGSTGAITVAGGQTGGSARVEATQTVTLPDSSTQTTTATSPPFNFTAIPSGIASTSASPGGPANMYGGEFTHTFASPAGGQAALERSHVNELFPAASGTTLNLAGPTGTDSLSIAVNSPNSASAGWDLDSSGVMVAPDHVNWSHVFSARPFVANASNPSPSHTLPHALTATQNFRNLTFPGQTYSSPAVASTSHRRAIEERNNHLKAVTSVNGQEVVEDYAGPLVIRNCRADPPAIPVATPAPPGGAAPAPTTSTITVDAEGQGAAPTFSIRPPNLGCTIAPGSGELRPGTNAGTVTVRAGDNANYDETTVTLIAKPSLTAFTIDNGAPRTAIREVTLDNTAAPPSPTHSSPTQYMASESADFAGASWQPYSASPSFTLSEGYGTKTVYLKLKNDAGESSVMSDTIEHALAPPSLTGFAIDNGAASAAGRVVTLDNTAASPSSAHSSPTQYMASENADFAGASWQPYSDSPSFTLSEGLGTKTVYLKLKNDAGESDVRSDTIERVAPAAP